jgi:hypothetical protein
MTDKEKKQLLSFAFSGLEQLKSCEGELDPEDIPCVSHLAYCDLLRIVDEFKQAAKTTRLVTEQDYKKLINEFIEAIAAHEADEDIR